MVRELKAVGGHLRAVRLALTGRASGPELWAVLAALPREETLRRVDEALWHLLTRRSSSCPRPRPGAHVLLRPDRLWARPRRQRAAVRDRHVAALVAARARVRGRRSSTTSRTSTTRSTTRRRTRARSWPSRRPAGTLRTPATSGSGMPDDVPKVDRARSRGSSTSSSADRRRAGLRGRGGRVLPRRALPRLRPAVGRAARTGREQEPNPLKEDPRDFALWKAKKPARTRTGSRRGAKAGRAGTSNARRWPRSCSGRDSRSTAAGSTSSSPTTRTSWPSRARSATRSRDIWLHNGMLQLGGEKMSKSLGNIVTIRNVLDEWGRETAAALLPRRPLAEAGRLLRRGDGEARAQAEGFRDACASRASAAGDWDAFEAALEDDFNTPEALALHARLARPRAAAPRARVFGLESFGGSTSRRPRSSRSPSGGSRRGRRSDFETADRLRGEIEARAGR